MAPPVGTSAPTTPEGPLVQANDWLIDHVRSEVPIDTSFRLSGGLTSNAEIPYTAAFEAGVYIPIVDNQHLGLTAQTKLEPGKFPLAFGGINLFKYADVTIGVTDGTAASTKALLRGQPESVALDAEDVDTVPSEGFLNPELRVEGGYGRTLYSPDMVRGGFAYGFGRGWRGNLSFYMPGIGGARDNLYVAGRVGYDVFHPEGELLSASPSLNVGHLDTEVAVLLSMDSEHELLLAPSIAYESYVDQDDQSFDVHSIQLGANLFAAPGTTKTDFARAYLQEYPIRVYAGLQHDWSGTTRVVNPAVPVEDAPADLSGEPIEVSEEVISQDALSVTQLNLHGEINLLSPYQERSKDVLFARVVLLGWIDAEIPFDGSPVAVSGGAKIELRAKTKMSDRQ